jgi:hypothetical protein
MAITKTYTYNKRTDDFGDLLGVAHRLTVEKDGVIKKLSVQEVVPESDELGIGSMTDEQLATHNESVLNASFTDEMIEEAFTMEAPTPGIEIT